MHVLEEYLTEDGRNLFRLFITEEYQKYYTTELENVCEFNNKGKEFSISYLDGELLAVLEDEKESVREKLNVKDYPKYTYAKKLVDKMYTLYVVGTMAMQKNDHKNCFEVTRADAYCVKFANNQAEEYKEELKALEESRTEDYAFTIKKIMEDMYLDTGDKPNYVFSIHSDDRIADYDKILINDNGDTKELLDVGNFRSMSYKDVEAMYGLITEFFIDRNKAGYRLESDLVASTTFYDTLTETMKLNKEKDEKGKKYIFKK